MPRKEIQEHLGFSVVHVQRVIIGFPISLGKTYCQSSRRLSVSETSLACGLVVHIHLVIACFVQVSDENENQSS